ncbi:hypothetical protein ABB37_00216 [Leptomonas pyrrhocoris]|uniref:Sperm-tail PG-rich repeat n=1 Tax=Leptomonas pyrrhocoris TaxID=157538 RepID=A0A0M9GA17_LEPPY|nr:hypothetical protein ABB37_00216 [Leptomonas pyrrhocoris]XP_015664343.1 hypothetical protein ABB37_00216 [Leptomonas pyrrhocoris]KPA85903.1 hypothetical protein ABB37_00216 [Leptomonas pyrrhocoris]KPA85904.1 hypothetical protein ABB37_00216 [Leptomonas pyrrhocoris]|eukprot:XP_015664342.1 hypothetical protein ABB37_00216 [Leptomonas pyrrhocoris]
MIGGFTNYAHLRLRDHRPGNGDYVLPPMFGPGADSSKRSILGRNYMPLSGESCSIGAGMHDVPSTIGTGRATRFASPLPSKATSSSKGDASRSLGSPAKAEASSLPLEPKQYSMALCPDTPSYSIYSRLKSEWELQSSYASPGPAAYAVPGYFDEFDPAQRQQQSGVAPGVHLGMRTDLLDARTREGVPGPGTYNLVRFGDELPRAHEAVLSRHRRPRGVNSGASDTPGPGAYDDPSSIGYRAAQIQSKRLFAPNSTFGGRWKKREFHTAGPGPAAYNTLHAAKLLERNQRHSPKFAATQPELKGRSARALRNRNKNVPDASSDSPQPLPTLPSDFDYNFRKGKSILGKWRVLAEQPRGAAVADTNPNGPGFWESPLPRGGRFTAGPYNPNAAQLAEETAGAELARGLKATHQVPGPGSYQPQSNLTECRAPAAIFGHTSSSKFGNADNGVPGPGHYRTIDDARGQGPVFYKGDFHPRGGDLRPSAEADNGGGPGAHYNDSTLYSCSINGDRTNNKGYTMGIRYPARATYQYCAPYDDTTNINCVYADELTWETKPKLQLPPVHSAAQ